MANSNTNVLTWLFHAIINNKLFRHMKYIYILFFSIIFFSFSSLFSQSKSIYVKPWVKKNEVILRWVPASEAIYKLAIKNGVNVVRYEKLNNALSSPVNVAFNLKPLLSKDTLKWAYVLKDNPQSVMAYKIILSLEKNETAVSKEEQSNNKMFYDMMLLTADLYADVSKACGLYIKDTTIISGKEYMYKFEVKSQLNPTKPITESISVNTGKLSFNPIISSLKGKIKGNKVQLKWNNKSFLQNYSGYNVERSFDSVNFKKVNDAPVIYMATQFEKQKDEITFDDTCNVQNQKVFYRLVGINHFGELGKPSNLVTLKTYRELFSLPEIDSLRVLNNQKVYLSWKMKDKNDNAYVKEYVLLKSKKDSGPYQSIFKTTSLLNYIDEKPDASNYYKVAAISNGNDTMYSYSNLALIIDTIPPAAPVGLKATVDIKGNVRLTWDKNVESDLQGYKIFKANSKDEEFVQVLNKFILTNEYKDKLNLKTLTKHIYYRVVATDKRFNNSNFSEIVEVKRPDTIPPVAAIINDLKLLQNGIKVSWIPSSSEDAKFYVLYRQNAIINKPEIKVKEWNSKDSLVSFLDTTLVLGEFYKYKIVLLDEDDNISVSNIPSIKYETGFRKKITQFNYEVDRASKRINLNWLYPFGDIEKYIIYRAKNEDTYTLIKTLNGSESSYIDTQLNIGNIYKYRIKAVYKSGVESILSDELKAEY